MKAQRPGAVLSEHAVQDERMGVQIQIQGRSKALDEGDGPAPPVRHALFLAGAPLQETEHRPDEDSDHRAAQRVIPGEHVANPMRQAQDPLAHGDCDSAPDHVLALWPPGRPGVR